MSMTEAKRKCVEYIRAALEAAKGHPRFFHEMRVFRYLLGAAHCLLEHRKIAEMQPYVKLLIAVRSRMKSKYGSKYNEINLPKRLRYKLGKMSDFEKRRYEDFCLRRKEKSIQASTNPCL